MAYSLNPSGMESVPNRVTRTMKHRTATATTGIALAGLLTLSACGSGAGGQTSSSNDSAGDESNLIVSPLPAIEVDDVTADRRVALDSFIPSDRPTLLWFWAPH